MRRTRKFILIGLLVAVVIGATLGGIAIAQADDDSDNQTSTRVTTLMEKVASIYEKNTGTAIDPAALQEAFKEAGQEIVTEYRDAYLQKLVDEGRITQEEADQYKTWLDSSPEAANRIGPFGGGCFGHGRIFGGFHGLCEPDTTD